MRVRICVNPVEQVLALLQSGKMSHTEYKAWDDSRNLQPEGKQGGRKTTCNLSRARFMAHAGQLAVDVGSKVIKGKVKDFKADADGKASFGWNITDKFDCIIDGVEVTVQLSGNAIIVGSKDAPK
jgi:hypothetical protein